MMSETNDNKQQKKFVALPKEIVESIVDGMIEINLKKHTNLEGKEVTNFKSIRNVLQRMGILKNNTIYQSVHILKKRDRYYLSHFKQLFALDGLESSYDEMDKNRLTKIAFLLDKMDIVDVIDKSVFERLEIEENNIYVHFVKERDIEEGRIKPVKKYDI